MSPSTETAFRVLRPGLLTTVQDMGRWGYQRYGIPVAGPMDQWSLLVANRLLGNQEGAAALEITVVGPTLLFLRQASIALCGADMSPRINGTPVQTWETLRVDQGDVLSFGECRSGCRAYLAINGGIAVDPVFGSRATDLRSRMGGFEGRALERGDVLGRYVPLERGPLFRRLAPRYRPVYGPEFELRVVNGPQVEFFDDAALAAFLGTPYTVTPASDRMGVRLHGEPLGYGGPDMLSEGVVPGSIQVPGDGQPIVLAADRQSAGGSPKVATIIAPDLGLVGQLKPGDLVWFSRIDQVAARRLTRRFLRALYGRGTTGCSVLGG